MVSFVVTGKVIDGDSANVTSQDLRLIDSTGGGFLVTTTDGSGDYSLDIDALGTSSGSTIIVRSTGGGYIGETSFTQDGSAGTTANVTVRFFGNATIRNEAWLTLYNHLITGDFAISTNNIFGAMNDQLIKEKGYPVVIIESPKIDNVRLTINDGDARRRNISFMIRVYSTEAKDMKILMDEIEDKITTGKDVLTRNRLRRHEFLEGDYDFYTDGDQTIHIGFIPVKFKLISDI